MNPADYLRAAKAAIDTPQKYLGIGLVKAFAAMPTKGPINYIDALDDIGYDPSLGEQQLLHSILMKAMDRAIVKAGG